MSGMNLNLEVEQEEDGRWLASARTSRRDGLWRFSG